MSQASASDYIRAPGGVLVHPSCFHVVPNGAVIDRDRNVIVGGSIKNGVVTGGTITEQLPECTHPAILESPTGPVSDSSSCPPSPGLSLTGSWVEASWACLTGANFFSALENYMNVPTGAIDFAGQQIYLFPSFSTAPSNTSSILQPVLQWGSQAPNGGCTNNSNGEPAWGISNWYLGPDGAEVASSPTCGVNPGDQIYNIMSAGTPCNGGECYWLSENCDFTTGVCNAINDFFAAVTFQNAQQGVLESDQPDGNGGVAFCNQLPNGLNGSATYSQTTVWENLNNTFSPTWVVAFGNYSAQCDYLVSNVSGGTTLHF
jgi:hypothetical protein